MRGTRLLIISVILALTLTACSGESGSESKGAMEKVVDKIESKQEEIGIKHRSEEIEKSVGERMAAIQQQLDDQQAKMQPALAELQSIQRVVLSERDGQQEVYVGSLANDVPEGFGRLEVLPDVSGIAYYQGQFADGLPNGIALVYYSSSSGDSAYVGEVKDGKLIGQGIYVDLLFDEPNSKTYIGEFIDFDSSGYFAEYSDEPDAITFQNGDFYKGGYTTIASDYDYSFEGEGIFSKGFARSNRFTYKGRFHENEPVPTDNGYGKVTLDNGDLYIGQVNGGVPNGLGAFIRPQSEEEKGYLFYFGNVVNGKAEGYGSLIGSYRYLGYFSDGEIQGAGFATSGDTEIRGLFDRGMDGVGRIVTSQYEFAGMFRNGTPALGEVTRDGVQYRGPIEEVEGKLGPQGVGQLTYSDYSYTGGIAGGYPDGEGVIAFADGAKFVGALSLGAAHGDGYYANGKGSEYVGFFRSGRPQDPQPEDSAKTIADFFILSESSRFMDLTIGDFQLSAW